MKIGSSYNSQTFITLPNGGNSWLYFSSVQYFQETGNNVIALDTCNSRVGMTLTPEEGKAINYSSVTFDLMSIGWLNGGGDTYEVYYNVYYKKQGDSSYTAIYDQDLRTGSNTVGAYGTHAVTTQTLDISTLGTLDSSVEIVLGLALIGPDSSRSSRSIGVSNFSVNGSIVDLAIPEPSGLFFALLGCAGLGISRKRKMA